MKDESRDIYLQDFSERSVEKIKIRSLSRRDRLLRALKLGGVCIALTCAALLIPLIHFLLVPILLIGTPFFAFKVYKQESALIRSKSACPSCHKPITKGPSFPNNNLCTHCQREIKMMKMVGIDTKKMVGSTGIEPATPTVSR